MGTHETDRARDKITPPLDTPHHRFHPPLAQMMTMTMMTPAKTVDMQVRKMYWQP